VKTSHESYIIIITNKVLIKVTLNKDITGAYKPNPIMDINIEVFPNLYIHSENPA